MVNIITPTLKAQISHEEKLNFCNYPVIKPLLTSHMSLNPLSSNAKVAAELWPSLHRQGQGKGLWFPLHRPKNLTAQIWVSGSSSALCACAGWPLAGSPLHSSLAWEKKFSPPFAKQSWKEKKKHNNQPRIFKVSTQRMQSSEHKTAGGAGLVLPLPVAYGKQENSAPFALCTIPVHSPDHQRVTSIQAFRRERKRVLV